MTEDWVDYVTTPTTLSPNRRYGAGFWLNPDRAIWPDLPDDAFAAKGFQGQIIFPSRKLVVVRLGASRVKSRTEDFAAAVIASLRAVNP